MSFDQWLTPLIALLPAVYAIIRIAYTAKQVEQNKEDINKLGKVTNERIAGLKSEMLSLNQDAIANSKATIELSQQVRYLTESLVELKETIKELRALVELLRRDTK